jgi:hypothetical protein
VSGIRPLASIASPVFFRLAAHAQVVVDQRLIGDVRLLGERVEIGNGARVEPDSSESVTIGRADLPANRGVLT